MNTSDLKIYTVKAGLCFSDAPKCFLPKKLPSAKSVYFYLDPSWANLFRSADHYTHKIAGWSDWFGKNSARIGIRRIDVSDNLIPVLYMHRNGRPERYDFKDYHFKLDTLYRFNYDQEALYDAELMELLWGDEINQPVATAAKWNLPTPVVLPSYGCLQYPYIELASGCCPWTIKTGIKFV